MIFNRFAVWIVRAVSLFFRALGPRACRFYPTCSAYSAEAFRRFGFFHASYLSAKRLFRCHPFTAGGFDPPR